MPARIDCLPIELLYFIFSNLTCDELVDIRNVCQLWNDILSRQVVWKDKVYKPNSTDTNEKIRTVLRNAPYLHGLDLSNVVVNEDVLNDLIKHCINLQLLQFHTEQNLGILYLKMVQMIHPNIVHLRLPGCKFYNAAASVVVGYYKHLTYLSIQDHSNSGQPVFLKYIAVGCPVLNELNIATCTYCMAELVFLIKKKGNQIEKLHIDSYTMENICIIPMISKFSLLTTLTLIHVDNAVLEEGANVAQNWPHLTSLSLYCVHPIDNKLMNTFLEKLNTGTTKLSSLSLIDCRMYQVLSAILAKHCQHLKQLNLYSCLVSNECLKDLPSLLELTDLNLCQEEIDENGIEYLKKCPKLERVVLEKCDKILADEPYNIHRTPPLKTLHIIV